MKLVGVCVIRQEAGKWELTRGQAGSTYGWRELGGRCRLVRASAGRACCIGPGWNECARDDSVQVRTCECDECGWERAIRE